MSTPIPIVVPVEGLGDVPFEMEPFTGQEEVRLAFRAIDGEGEHYINRYAAALTSTSWGANSDSALRARTNDPNFGRMCHVELLMQIQPKVWTRHSVYMGTLGADGNITPGTVHSKLVDDATVRQKLHIDGEKYHILSLLVGREHQANAMRFITRQIGSPFNKQAYNYNILGANFGTPRYDYSLNTESRPFFCTEFVTCALQAMVATERARRGVSWGGAIWAERANHSSPNSLYRIMKTSRGVTTTFFVESEANSALL